MFWGYLLCTCACASALPAIAGERPSTRLAPDANAVAIARAKASFGKRAILPPAAPEARTPSRPIAIYTLNPQPIRAARLEQVSATTHKPGRNRDAEGVALWQVSDALPPATAERGGSYAVGDTLASNRKRRSAGSALKTMLVLRIDGNDESPPFSIGGGVAGALWRALPTR